ncbi:MAG: histidine kinase [Propionibacteriaceae bacterium]|nr:histidine kinase [Propionibacteriaceae bacterium]
MTPLRRRRAARLAAAEAQRTGQAVAAERQRIAREMHDIIAHSLSDIVAQADGGHYAAAQDPTAADRALTAIAETGRAALADTRRVLGLLRNGPEDQRSPVPSSDTVADLVATVRASGLDVVHVVIGRVRKLPPGVRLALYRICQESLTNVLKHAGPGAQAIVTESYGDHGLRLTVWDTGARTAAGKPAALAPPPPWAAAAGAGHGIVGMKERAELFDGAVAAEPDDDGGFRVRLDLPYPEGSLWETADPAPPDQKAASL